MSIIVTMAFADGAETGSTPTGADALNVFVTVQNLSASSVTVTSAAVFSIPNTAPCLIGQMVFPQGGTLINGSSTVTLPNVSVTFMGPQQANTPATASTNTIQLVAAVQVSDGSTGTSSPQVAPIVQALNPPAQYATITPQFVQGSTTNSQYSNVDGPGQMQYDAPALNSSLVLFPALGFGL